ncbi:MAG TPA: sn-glycerol-3-phosphate ABC transporter ATP-binding protein UgpC [Verrucomicrobiae bacterium]|nr:sn-glycerol-3-phosphate ABC transporter ATP-binding protein UgpC [Verrucomicrobiae bacterium]
MAVIEFDNVSKSFGDGVRAVDGLSLRIEDGEFMIFVGPSGCGKTTALRMVAGLEEVSSGEIRIDGKQVHHLEPQDRDVAMVFQNYALYPHMKVSANIGFPLRMQHKSKAEIERSVREVAQMLGIEALLDRKPRELSGGQRQRVAMGRAIVRHPRAFLMDEPLSNLDAKLRIQMRVELVRLHRRLGVTTIYVTHDQTEAMTLGQRVAVLNQGRIQQVAPPRQLYLHPVNTFVASFIGSPPMNFLRGRLRPGGIDLGPVGVDLPPEVMGRVMPGKAELVVGLRPESLRLLPPDTVAAGTLAAEIEVIEQLGAESYVYVRVPGIEAVEFADRPGELAGALCARVDGLLDLAAGERIALGLRPELVRLFDAETGESRLAEA